MLPLFLLCSHLSSSPPSDQPHSPLLFGCPPQVMPLMAQGFRMGLVKFVLISGRKPE
jgi:hypothetical protein